MIPFAWFEIIFSMQNLDILAYFYCIYHYNGWNRLKYVQFDQKENFFKSTEWYQEVILVSNKYQKRVEHAQNDRRIQYEHYRKLGRTHFKWFSKRISFWRLSPQNAPLPQYWGKGAFWGDTPQKRSVLKIISKSSFQVSYHDREKLR